VVTTSAEQTTWNCRDSLLHRAVPLIAMSTLLAFPAIGPPSVSAALPVYEGSMTFPQIDSSSGPEEFSWEIALSEGRELVQLDERTAEIRYENGHPATDITAEPAHDAEGATVPTTLSVTQPNVITLVVHHRAGNPAAGGAPFVYPVAPGEGWEGGFTTERVQGPPDESASKALGSESKRSGCLRTSAGVGGGCTGFPSLIAIFGGRVAPRKLPRSEMAPVGMELWGRVKTTDGSHPSALREAIIDLDRDVELDARGLPACHPPGKVNTHKSLRKVCRSAIVGGGRADFEVAFSERAPIKEGSHLTVYNRGVSDGVTTLLAVASIDVRVPQSIVTPIKITKIRRGRYGLRAVAMLPVIAGGSGSLLDFKLRLKRLFEYKRRRSSLVTARCPDGKLDFGFPELLFRNEANTPGVAATTQMKGSSVVPCMSKR
jgi:hypothetical protein